MTGPIQVSRLLSPKYAFELYPDDLLLNDDGVTWRRIVSIVGGDPLTVTFEDASTENYPSRTPLAVYRAQSKLPAAFADSPLFTEA